MLLGRGVLLLPLVLVGGWVDLVFPLGFSGVVV